MNQACAPCANQMSCMQERVKALTSWTSVTTSLQLLTLLFIILYWLACAGRIPAIGIIAGSVSHSFVPLAELGLVILVILSLLGTLCHVQLGERLRDWSTFGRVMRIMMKDFLIGASAHFKGTSCPS